MSHAVAVLPERPRPLSVSQVNALVAGAIEEKIPGSINVEGELTNYRPYASGHWYFSLKDATCQLKGVMFRSDAARCTFKPKDGDKVIATGGLRVYRERGEYQLYVSRLAPAGLGDLQKAFEELKAKLKAEGLFDAARKRPIPRFPRVVGIVTSPSGAAIRDLIKIITRRHAGVEIVLRPAQVQGAGAAADIAAAIRDLNRNARAEVLIVGRGGGSLEDLWAFNEEAVARAIAASEIPVISAVGHEIDFTISDFVADLRAATPSEAAELVAPEREKLIEAIEELRRRGAGAVLARVNDARQRVRDLARRLVLSSPRKLWQAMAQRVDELALRLNRRFGVIHKDIVRQWQDLVARLRRQEPRARLTAARERWEPLSRRLARVPPTLLAPRRQRIDGLRKRLDGLNPEGVLQRGYSIVRKVTDRKIVRRSRDVVPKDVIEITLGVGKLVAAVEKAE